MHGLPCNRWLFPYLLPSQKSTIFNLPFTLFFYTCLPSKQSTPYLNNNNNNNNNSKSNNKNTYFDPDFHDTRLKSCYTITSLKQIHSFLSTIGFIEHNPHLSAQIIIRYSKFGDSESARSLFDTVAGTNSFLWNTMIRGYANEAQHEDTLQLYLLMRENGVPPNNYTFPFVLKACAALSLVLEGKSVHGNVIRTGFESGLHVEAALVDMYSKCGQTDDGRRVFDKMSERDLVCWTAMITAYEQSERAEESLALFHQMQQEGFTSDSVVMVGVASAVAQLGDLDKARSLHAHGLRIGFLEDIIVGNSVVAMYTKCSEVKVARLVFDRMKERDEISWNSMLSGYTQNGHGSEALSLFDQMLVSRAKPNPVTALIIVSTCAYLGSLQLGRNVHSFIISSRMEVETTLWNAIIDMYAKCGDLETAARMFNNSCRSRRNVSSWNVMISGYGMHGHGSEALEIFSRMQEEGIEPNHITFTCLLSACSHAGLIDEGRKCFDDMRKGTNSMKPTVKHYACMVDMLGRAGLLDEARNLISQMPSEPNDGVWGALLGACRIHGNTALGEFAAKNLFLLEPEHSGYYVLMSNIYAASNKWHEVGKLRQAMKSRGLKKPAAYSIIEYGKEVHGFHTADHSHPQYREIYRKVESLVAEMKMVGYVRDGSCVLHDVEEEEKEHILNSHGEKLAVAFGIMNVDAGMPILVTKNLRVCNDCHLVFKFISSVYKRKIIIRDANRFHHLQDGLCSCKDYW